MQSQPRTNSSREHVLETASTDSSCAAINKCLDAVGSKSGVEWSGVSTALPMGDLEVVPAKAPSYKAADLPPGALTLCVLEGHARLVTEHHPGARALGSKNTTSNYLQVVQRYLITYRIYAAPSVQNVFQASSGYNSQANHTGWSQCAVKHQSSFVLEPIKGMLSMHVWCSAGGHTLAARGRLV